MNQKIPPPSNYLTTVVSFILSSGASSRQSCRHGIRRRAGRSCRRGLQAGPPRRALAGERTGAGDERSDGGASLLQTRHPCRCAVERVRGRRTAKRRSGRCPHPAPYMEGIFVLYPLSDDFACLPEYELLCTELTGAIAIHFEENGI